MNNTDIEEKYTVNIIKIKNGNRIITIHGRDRLKKPINKIMTIEPYSTVVTNTVTSKKTSTSTNKMITLGLNLGFIEKILLVDGSIIENGSVLYKAPIPDNQILKDVFNTANEYITKYMTAQPSWSDYGIL